MRNPPDPLAPKHYSDRVEVKFRYAIDTKRPKTHYRSESYFFVPRSIGLDRYTYSRDEFFSDMNVFVRFAEPGIPASILANKSDRNSPLHRATAAILTAAQTGAAIPQPKVSNEMRMFACVVRTNLRHVATDVQVKIKRLESSSSTESVLTDDVRKGSDRLLADIDGQLGALRAVRETFVQPGRPTWLTDLYASIDEYVSIAAEECLTSVLIKLDAMPSHLRTTLNEHRDRIAAAIVSEQDYRESARYIGADLAHGNNRTYIDRVSALSRFVRSVLFLEVMKEDEGRRVRYMIGGIAAAIGTAFSTAVAVWARIAYGIDSFPFLVAIMVGYVFRDRIRQWLRTYFRQLVARRMYDYSVRIREPNTKTVLGVCRESFEFVPMSEVPPDVLEHRYRNASPLEPQNRSEVVMKYVRDVTLRGRRIAQFGRRVRHLTEMHRFNITRLLTRMSEPEEIVASYSRTVNQVVGVQCPKTYQINLVVTRSDDRQPPTTGRYCMTLNKCGLKAVQLMHGSRYDAEDRTPSIDETRSPPPSR